MGQAVASDDLVRPDTVVAMRFAGHAGVWLPRAAAEDYLRLVDNVLPALANRMRISDQAMRAGSTAIGAQADENSALRAQVKAQRAVYTEMSAMLTAEQAVRSALERSLRTTRRRHQVALLVAAAGAGAAIVL